MVDMVIFVRRFGDDVLDGIYGRMDNRNASVVVKQIVASIT